MPAGRWTRVFSSSVQASWWGLLGDGSDETALLQAALDAAAGRGIAFSELRTCGFGGALAIPDDARVTNNGATFLLL